VPFVLRRCRAYTGISARSWRGRRSFLRWRRLRRRYGDGQRGGANRSSATFPLSISGARSSLCQLCRGASGTALLPLAVWQTPSIGLLYALRASSAASGAAAGISAGVAAA